MKITKKEQKILIEFVEAMQQATVKLLQSEIRNILIIAELAEASAALLATTSQMMDKKVVDGFLEKVSKDVKKKITTVDNLINETIN